MGLSQYFSFQTGMSASLSNFQGTVIRIKRFFNRSSQKYLEKNSALWKMEAQEQMTTNWYIFDV